MSARTAEYLNAIEHLPEGATLVIQQFTWNDYESLLEDLRDRPHLRVSYDQGKLEIMSPLPEHEEYGRFIDDLVRAFAQAHKIKVQNYGAATWKKQRLGKGVEPDCCYYVANAIRVIGKRKFDLEIDPPPDIVVEIDITNESLSKFPIYVALSVPEIWRYDSKKIQFYELAGDTYREVPERRFFPGLIPAMLAAALEQGKKDGQDAALDSFRQQWTPIQ
jgi:Uma2 family endonuclease